MKRESKPIYSKRLTIRISDELLNKAKEKAKSLELTLAAYVRMLIKKGGD